jgi:hypothetical protein
LIQRRLLEKSTSFLSNTMTHRTVVNCETGEVTQVEYTPEEQAIHDAAVAAQQAAELAQPAQG